MDSVVRVKFVHPFIRYEREFSLDSSDSLMQDVMTAVTEETKEHGRYGRRGKQQIDRLRGCIVLRNNNQVGYFDTDGFRVLEGADDGLRPNDEIVIMLPVTGG